MLFDSNRNNYPNDALVIFARIVIFVSYIFTILVRSCKKNLTYYKSYTLVKNKILHLTIITRFPQKQSYNYSRVGVI